MTYRTGIPWRAAWQSPSSCLPFGGQRIKDALLRAGLHLPTPSEEEDKRPPPAAALPSTEVWGQGCRARAVSSSCRATMGAQNNPPFSRVMAIHSLCIMHRQPTQPRVPSTRCCFLRSPSDCKWETHQHTHRHTHRNTHTHTQTHTKTQCAHTHTTPCAGFPKNPGLCCARVLISQHLFSHQLHFVTFPLSTLSRSIHLILKGFEFFCLFVLSFWLGVFCFVLFLNCRLGCFAGIFLKSFTLRQVPSCLLGSPGRAHAAGAPPGPPAPSEPRDGAGTGAASSDPHRHRHPAAGPSSLPQTLRDGSEPGGSRAAPTAVPDPKPLLRPSAGLAPQTPARHLPLLPAGSLSSPARPAPSGSPAGSLRGGEAQTQHGQSRTPKQRPDTPKQRPGTPKHRPQLPAGSPPPHLRWRGTPGSR